MTAVMTASGVGSPLGRILVGPVYAWGGNAGAWVLIAGGLSLGTVLFVAAAIRGSGDATSAPGAQSPALQRAAP